MRITLSLIIVLLACTIFGIHLIRQTIKLNKSAIELKALAAEANKRTSKYYHLDDTLKNVNCQDIQDGQTFEFKLRGKL